MDLLQFIEHGSAWWATCQGIVETLKVYNWLKGYIRYIAGANLSELI